MGMNGGLVKDGGVVELKMTSTATSVTYLAAGLEAVFW